MSTAQTRDIEVMPGVHAISCADFVRAYLLVDRDRVTIVDTGIVGLGCMLLETLVMMVPSESTNAEGL